MAAFDEQMPAPGAHVLRVSSMDKLAQLVSVSAAETGLSQASLMMITEQL